MSTFGKAASEYGSTGGNRSPAPYATSSIVGSTRFVNYNNSAYQTHRPAFPNPYRATHEVYVPSNRSVYSESYYFPKDKIHITENKLNNMPNCHTFNPSSTTEPGHSPFGTIRRGRFKFSRPAVNFGELGSSVDSANRGDMSSQQKYSPYQKEQLQHHLPHRSDYQQQQHLHGQQQTNNVSIGDESNDYGPRPSPGASTGSQEIPPMNQQDNEQLYIKVGETNPPDNGYMNWRRESACRNLYNRNGGGGSIGSNNGSGSVGSGSISGRDSVRDSGNAVNNSGVIGICSAGRRHNKDSCDSDVIYAPGSSSGNRSLINYVNPNQRINDV